VRCKATHSQQMRSSLKNGLYHVNPSLDPVFAPDRCSSNIVSARVE
jgi:hypothetical protein